MSMTVLRIIHGTERGMSYTKSTDYGQLENKDIYCVSRLHRTRTHHTQRKKQRDECEERKMKERTGQHYLKRYDRGVNVPSGAIRS